MRPPLLFLAVRHAPPPRVRGGLAGRVASLVAGLFVCALGIVLVLRAGLGLPPWDVLHQGLTLHTPLSFGLANIAVSAVILTVAWRLGARLGLGTVANAVLVGVFADLLLETDAIPDLAGHPLPARLAVLALGIAAFGLGSALYIGAGMGAGPRDSLMLVVADRLGVRVGVARAAVELAALGAGIALGGPIGLGTAAFALLVGPAVELAFLALRRSPLARPAAVAAETI